MLTINIHEAKTHLSRFIEKAAAGEEIIIALAATGDKIEIPLAELKEQVLAMKESTGLNLQPTLARLEQAKSCPGGILMI